MLRILVRMLVDKEIGGKIGGFWHAILWYL
jgi:hypothetical protein